nr:MAG TPA: hypothetical protein [Caudoviricetes sp.]
MFQTYNVCNLTVLKRNLFIRINHISNTSKHRTSITVSRIKNTTSILVYRY